MGRFKSKLELLSERTSDVYHDLADLGVFGLILVFNTTQEIRRYFGEKFLGRKYYDEGEEWNVPFTMYRRIE